MSINFIKDSNGKWCGVCNVPMARKPVLWFYKNESTRLQTKIQININSGACIYSILSYVFIDVQSESFYDLFNTVGNLRQNRFNLCISLMKF